MNLQQLLNKIYKVFESIPYPRYDYYYAVADLEYMDLDEVRESTEEKKLWSDITIENMVSHQGFIHFPNDSEKIYYFPIYMKYILTSNELLGHGIDITFLLVLKKMELSVLNKEQLLVILDFLEFCKKNNNHEYEYDEELLNTVYKKIFDYIELNNPFLAPIVPDGSL